MASCNLQAIVVQAYRFAATRGVAFKDLRFPFPLRWHAGRGIHQLSTRHGGERIDLRGEASMRVEELFDVQLFPDQTGAATGRLEIDLVARDRRSEPDWTSLALSLSCGRGFGLALTQSMFALPSYPWALEPVAAQIGTKPRSIQMALFRESYSFDAALRRCRHLDALLRTGFDRCRFEAIAEQAA